MEHKPREENGGGWGGYNRYDREDRFRNNWNNDSGYGYREKNGMGYQN